MPVMLVVFLTVFMDLLGFGIVIPLLTYYAEDFGATPLEVTLLMSCYSLAQFLFAPFWGALSDRHGRRPILLGSIGMGALMLWGFASAQSLMWMFIFRSLHGLFAANISTAQACMADITTPENRAKGMGLIGAAFGLGFTAGPWLGGELSVYGLAFPIQVAAGLGAFNFLLAVFVLPETRHADSTTRPRPIGPGSLLQSLRHPSVGRWLLLSAIMTFSFAMMESTFALFEEHQHGLGAREVGRLLGLIGITMVIIQGGLIGRLTRRWGELRLIQIGLPGLALGILGLVYATPGAALIATCIGLAIFQGLAQPSLYAQLSKSAPAAEQGLILGTNQSLAALGRAFGPALAGLLFEQALPAPFMVAAGVLFLASAMAWSGRLSAD